jgi:hypothetical protein
MKLPIDHHNLIQIFYVAPVISYSYSAKGDTRNRFESHNRKRARLRWKFTTGGVRFEVPIIARNLSP